MPQRPPPAQYDPVHHGLMPLFSVSNSDSSQGLCHNPSIVHHSQPSILLASHDQIPEGAPAVDNMDSSAVRGPDVNHTESNSCDVPPHEDDISSPAASRTVPKRLKDCTVAQLGAILGLTRAELRTHVKPALLQKCGHRGVGLKELRTLPEETWEQLQVDRASKKRQKLIMNTTREENIGTSLSGAALDDDTNAHMNQHRATIPWPYQSLRMEAMRLMLERDHDFTFTSLQLGASSDADVDADADGTAEAPLTLDRFRREFMQMDTKLLPQGNGCCLTPLGYRVKAKSAAEASTMETYSTSSLSNYSSRCVEFLAFVLRRCELVWPLLTPDNIQAFLTQYVQRAKKSTSIAQAHNTTTTQDMLANVRKALNWVAWLERSDPMWESIIHDGFPVSTYQWPPQWFETKYAPASGEVTSASRRRLKQLEGEKQCQDSLPHPSMIQNHVRTSRSEFQRIVQRMMELGQFEMAANETHCTQGIQRKYCYGMCAMMDLAVVFVEQDRDLGQLEIFGTTFLSTTIRGGKGNSAGCKDEGVMRHKMLWACSVSHLAWLLHKRYVWCEEKNGPLIDVDWADLESWSTHKVIGNSHQDPTASLPALQISQTLSAVMQETLGYGPVRLACVKKNGGNRVNGANEAIRNGASPQDVQIQGGWTGQHSSADKNRGSVLETHYLQLDSHLPTMQCSAGYKIGDKRTDAGGREAIPVGMVTGQFFGDIISQLTLTLQEVT